MKQIPLAKTLWIVTALGAAACDVTYVIAPTVDGGPSATSDAAPMVGQDGPKPFAGIESKPILGAQVACSEWGKGVPLKAPQEALSTLTTALWGTDARMKLEAGNTYGPALADGTTGDVYCIVLHMLGAVPAREGVAAFYTQWLRLDQIQPKDPARYGNLTFDAAISSARAFAVEATLGGDKRFARLFAAQRPIEFASGVPALSPISTQYKSLSGGGVLSEAGVLAAFSGKESWPSARGAMVRDTFLCEKIPPGPDLGISPSSQDQSIPFREWHELSLSSPSCNGCHKLIDPIGYALDVFDAVGRAHNLDRHGQRFDLAGELNLTSGETFAIASPADVAKVLASSIDAKACYLKTWVATFNKARGQDVAVDETSEPDLWPKRAKDIDSKNGFVMPEAIATAARLSFELQP